MHRAVLREVTVEAYRIGSQRVGGKRKPYSVGIDLAECVKGVEGHRPEGGGIDGEPGVDVGQVVLPELGVGIAAVVGKVVHKRESHRLSGAHGGALLGCLHHNGVLDDAGQHLLGF